MLELRCQEGRFGTLRFGHHEVGFERLLAVLRHLAALGVDLGGLHLAEINELTFEVLLDWRDEQRARGARIGRPQRIEHGPVVIEPEADLKHRHSFPWFNWAYSRPWILVAGTMQ